MADVPGDVYAATVRGDGATAHWRLNERRGSSVADSVGGNTGTISGGVTFDQGGVASDSAMAFNGIDAKIAVPDGAFQTFGTGPLSVEWWMRTTLLQSFNIPLISNATGVILDNNNGVGGVSFSVNDGTASRQVTVPTFAYCDGRWHHYVGTLARGANDVLSLYVDGVSRVSMNMPTPGASVLGAGALMLGSHYSPGYWYTGLLDEVAIYKVALTPAQIANHYAIATGPPPPGFSNVVADPGISATEPPPPLIDMTIPGWSNSPRGADVVVG